MADYSIAEAEFEKDAAAISAVWVKNLSRVDAESAAEKLRLGYVGNPAGPGTVLLLRARGDARALGTLGLHPRRLHLGSRIIPTVTLADFAVDREHRSLGPAMMLMRKGIEYGADHFEMTYGFPNRRAAPIFAACKLKRLGDLQRFAKPLRSLPYLSRRLPRWAARVSAPVMDLALHLIDRRREASLEPVLNCRSVNWDDPFFNRLWARRPSGVLMSERTDAMLAWRFGRSERTGWQVCAGDDRNGESRGYVVWRDTSDFVEVGDFGADDPETVTASLMMAFTRFIRGMGAHTISVDFFGPAPIAAQLVASGLRRRPEECPVFLGSRHLAGLDTPPDWFVTAFDSDAD